jgi:hypothetical protein
VYASVYASVSSSVYAGVHVLVDVWMTVLVDVWVTVLVDVWVSFLDRELIGELHRLPHLEAPNSASQKFYLSKILPLKLLPLKLLVQDPGHGLHHRRGLRGSRILE